MTEEIWARPEQPLGKHHEGTTAWGEHLTKPAESSWERLWSLLLSYCCRRHDYGKRHPWFQEALSPGSSSKKEGYCHAKDLQDLLESDLLKYEKSNSKDPAKILLMRLTLMLTGGHHAGMDSTEDFELKQNESRIDEGRADRIREALMACKNAFVTPNLNLIGSFFGNPKLKSEKWLLQIDKLDLRMLLSLLRLSDRLDASGNTPDGPDGSNFLRRKNYDLTLRSWSAGSDAKFTEQGRHRNELRARLRDQAGEIARARSQEPSLFLLDAPVGSGKTLAALEFMTTTRRVCPHIRRLIIVKPYKSQVDQDFDVAKSFLFRSGDESPASVLAVHSDKETNLGEKPEEQDPDLMILTAVRLFDALANHGESAGCRILPYLKDSVVFIDEFHQCVSSEGTRHYLPLMLMWLRDLTMKWGCRFLLGSGTMPDYGKLLEWGREEPWYEWLSKAERISVGNDWGEELRVCVKSSEYENQQELVDRVAKSAEKDSVLVVRNVVEATIRTAMELAERFPEWNIRCVHSALRPEDRRKHLEEVRAWSDARKRGERKPGCILVATSSVDSGMDFSFSCGYRERWDLYSLFQVKGRVNRFWENESGGVVHDFSVADEADSRNIPEKNLLRRLLNQETAEILQEWENGWWENGWWENDVKKKANEFLRMEQVKDRSLGRWGSMKEIAEKFMLIPKDDSHVTALLQSDYKDLLGEKCDDGDFSSWEWRRKASKHLRKKGFQILKKWVDEDGGRWCDFFSCDSDADEEPRGVVILPNDRYDCKFGYVPSDLYKGVRAAEPAE